MDEKITRETYIRKKLEQEIGELKGKIYELEFSVILFSEENEKLKKEISELRPEKEEKKENPTI